MGAAHTGKQYAYARAAAQVGEHGPGLVRIAPVARRVFDVPELHKRAHEAVLGDASLRVRAADQHVARAAHLRIRLCISPIAADTACAFPQSP